MGRKAQEVAKEAAGKAAAQFVQNDMVVGLGTGSTAYYFIKYLSERCKEGLRVHTVATSRHSAEIAKGYGIPAAEINEIDEIDLTVDGADEIDLKKRMIKGGGGALFHEKIIASMSQEMVVVVDSSKIVRNLGKFPLPVEISSFGFLATLKHLQDRGYKAALRKDKNGQLFYTDGGNLIADISLSYPCHDPESENQKIKNIIGVIETGFFFNLARRVVVGYSDGRIEIFGD